MSAFEDRFAELRAKFAERSLSDRDRLKAAFDHNDREGLKQIAHSLAGNGGLFGYPQVSAAGLALEEAIDNGVDGEALGAAVRNLVAELDSVDQPG